MDSKYIDIQKINQTLDAAFEWHDPWDKIYTILYINGLPPEEVKPIIHAHWRVVDHTHYRDKITKEIIDTIDHCECTHCKTQWDFYWSEQRFPYCFSCGAQMDEKIETDTDNIVEKE